MDTTPSADTSHPFSGLIPEIDEHVPLPASALEALPPLTPFEEAEMKIRTADLIRELKAGKTDIKAATPPIDPAFAAPPAKHLNPTAAYLARMKAEYDVEIVEDLSTLKHYVINKLLQESEHPDPKIRLTALKALGEVDGVDAFKKRSEMTVKQQPIEEVEAELKETLAKLKNRVNLTVNQPITDVKAKKIKKIVPEDADIDPENPDADANADDAR